LLDELIGKRFTKLIVDSFHSKINNCICDCGNTKITNTTSLCRKRHSLKSCGCLGKEAIRKSAFKHGAALGP
jgi:hypothetical protein